MNAESQPKAMMQRLAGVAAWLSGICSVVLLFQHVVSSVATGLDTWFGGEEQAISRMENMGEEGRVAYIHHTLNTGILMALCQMIFVGSLLVRWSRIDLFWMPIAGLLLDAASGIANLILIASYPKWHKPIALYSLRWGPRCSIMKKVLLVATLAQILRAAATSRSGKLKRHSV